MTVDSYQKPKIMKFLSRANALSVLSLSIGYSCHGFRIPFSPSPYAGLNVNAKRGSVGKTLTSLYMSNTPLSVSLEKPLGIILEEVEEDSPMGVKVEELSDSGSAFNSEYKDLLVGLKVAEVMGDDCRSIGFDDVMDKIINAPSPVTILFESLDEGMDTDDDTENGVSYDVGTTVSIKVLQEGKDTIVIEDAKVGDNLRKTLLANNVELYRGLKKKLGNCGGGGQCTFCAVDFVEDECEGWLEKSDYEKTKIPKYPTARLACMNNIMGPATIRVE